MNQAEALTLVSYLNRAGMLQALEGQASVWSDALEDVDVKDSIEAARALAKTQARWITPGDIRAGVTQIRRRRLDNLGNPAPPDQIDPADTARYLGWLRSYISATASGHEPPEADRLACLAVRVTRRDQIASARPVKQLVAQVAADGQATERRMAREHDAVKTAARAETAARTEGATR